MRKSIFTLLSSMMVLSASAQLVNNGATITVQAGATLMVESNVDNQAGGVINLEGNAKLEIQGNFNNLVGAAGVVASPTSKLIFSGNSGTNPVDFNANGATFGDVIISKATAGNVNLIGNVTIVDSLDFNSSGVTKLNLGTNTLTLSATAKITGADIDEYIVTGPVGAVGTGTVVKNYATGALSSSAFKFEVGDAVSYSPLETAVTGTAAANATLTVRVNDIPATSLTTGTTDNLSRYWDVDHANFTTYNNAVTGTYVTSDDVVGDVSKIKGASREAAGQWNHLAFAGVPAVTATTGTVSGTISSATGTAVSDFTGMNFFGKAFVKVFLQGAYNAGTGLMSTSLNARSGTNILQANATTSPYVDAPAMVAPNFFYDAANPTVNQDIVDWVKLEFRDPATPTTASTKKVSAFLKKDGSIVATDGISNPFVKEPTNNSVVVISHRNHLPIRTINSGISVVEPTTVHDFSSNLTQAFDNVANVVNDAMVNVTGTTPKLCLWGGNGSGNNQVRFSTTGGDYNYLLNTSATGLAPNIGCGGLTTSNLLSVYSNADFNMNGAVRFGTTGGDYNFLLNSSLSGITTKIINQHL